MQASALRANSMNLDRHGFGFLSLGFGYVNAQHSVLGLSVDVLGIYVIRQHETTREGAVNAFNANGVFTLVLAFQFSFAADGDDTVCHGNLHVFPLDVRKLDPDEIFILAFADVRERYPISRRGFIPSDPVIRQVKRRKSTQHIFHFPKRFPTQHGHDESSYNEPRQMTVITTYRLLPRGRRRIVRRVQSSALIRINCGAKCALWQQAVYRLAMTRYDTDWSCTPRPRSRG